MLPPSAPITGFIFDLDGTVYRGDAEVPGAADFIQLVGRRAIPCMFVTNRANRHPSEIVAHLRRFGISATTEAILTSAQATATRLKGRRIYCIGEAGMRTELENAGNCLTEENPDTVVVSLDRQFNYEKLLKACRSIAAGANYIASNPDLALATHEGPVPGTGAILAAIEAVTGRRPLVVGKPEPAIMLEAARRMNLPPDGIVAVGDSPHTDIPAGYRAGMRTALLISGTLYRHATHEVAPTWTLEAFTELTTILDDCNGKNF